MQKNTKVVFYLVLVLFITNDYFSDGCSCNFNTYTCGNDCSFPAYPCTKGLDVMINSFLIQL